MDRGALMIEATIYANFARKHYPSDTRGLSSPEDIGRHLVSVSSSGPRLWCGINILRALGLLHDHERLQ